MYMQANKAIVAATKVATSVTCLFMRRTGNAAAAAALLERVFTVALQ
jgi:hypothetical protein